MRIVRSVALAVLAILALLASTTSVALADGGHGRGHEPGNGGGYVGVNSANELSPGDTGDTPPGP